MGKRIILIIVLLFVFLFIYVAGNAGTTFTPVKVRTKTLTMDRNLVVVCPPQGQIFRFDPMYYDPRDIVQNQPV